MRYGIITVLLFLLLSTCFAGTSGLLNFPLELRQPVEAVNDMVIHLPGNIISFKINFGILRNHFIFAEKNFKMTNLSFLNITSTESSTERLVLELAEWVNNNINYSYTGLIFPNTNFALYDSDTEILQNGRGICSDMANLLVSLLYDEGIPARRVIVESIPNSFIPLWESSFDSFNYYHSFAEFYDNGVWRAVDPMLGKIFDKQEFTRKGYAISQALAFDYENVIDVTKDYAYNLTADFAVNDSRVLINISAKNVKIKIVKSYYNNGVMQDYEVSPEKIIIDNRQVITSFSQGFDDVLIEVRNPLLTRTLAKVKL